MSFLAHMFCIGIQTERKIAIWTIVFIRYVPTYPLWAGDRIWIEFIFHGCSMRQLKESTAWYYTGLQCKLSWEASPKCRHHSQVSCAQSSLNHFYTLCNMLLTGLLHSPVVSIPLLLSSNSSILPLHLPPLLLSLTYRRVISYIIVITRIAHMTISTNRIWIR